MLCLACPRRDASSARTGVAVGYVFTVPENTATRHATISRETSADGVIAVWQHSPHAAWPPPSCGASHAWTHPPCGARAIRDATRAAGSIWEFLNPGGYIPAGWSHIKKKKQRKYATQLSAPQARTVGTVRITNSEPAPDTQRVSGAIQSVWRRSALR